jgi:nitrogen regulatory protein P-II 1
MIKVTCYVRPHRLEEVKTAISSLGVTGMSVSDVRGCGSSPERPTWFAGQELLVALPVRSKVVVVVPDELSERVVQAVLDVARTGEPGDGKLFLEPVEDAVRIRTRERGDAAV